MIRIVIRLLLFATVLLTLGDRVVLSQSTPGDVPDEVAYEIFFQIMRSAPPPHWDTEMKESWLKDRGFSSLDVSKLIQAANEYFIEVEPLNVELKARNEMFKGQNDSPQALAAVNPILAQKRAVMQRRVQALRSSLGIGKSLDLSQHISEMKKKIKHEVSTRVTTPLPEAHH